MACRFQFLDLLNKKYNEDIFNNGVYKITNTLTNNFYIGSASSKTRTKCQSGFYVRIKKHIKDLQKNIHSNIHLQNALNKYGKDNFVFEVLAICPDKYCIKLEQWFIDNLKPDYNICKIAGSRKGVPLSKEHKESIGLSNSQNKEAGKNISKAKKGQKYNMINKRRWYKRSDQGLTNNRIKRRLHKSITNFCDKDILNIRQFILEGKTIKSLASKYGVHYATISDIKHFRTFKDLKL